jgi:hypothetical protein
MMVLQQYCQTAAKSLPKPFKGVAAKVEISEIEKGRCTGWEQAAEVEVQWEVEVGGWMRRSY